MPFLGNTPTEVYKSLAKQTITGDGSTSYALDHNVGSAVDLEVFVNNVRQEPEVAYTASGAQITFTTALEASDECYVIFQGKAISSNLIESQNIEDGSVTSAKIADSSITDAKISSITPEQYMTTPFGRRNWIINGDFQVSQRGDYATSPVVVGGDAYCVDRWQCSDNSAVDTVQIVNGYLRRTIPTARSASTYMQTKVENFNSKFVGQTVTISGKCNTNSSNLRLWLWQGSWETVGSISGDFSITYTVVDNSLGYENIRFAISDPINPNTGISAASGEYFELSEVQLEVGSVATPFEHRSYGEELALCQRYFQSINLYGVTAMRNPYFGEHHVWIPFITEMRTLPTFTTPYVGNYQPGGGTGTVSIQLSQTKNGVLIDTGSPNTNTSYMPNYINSGANLLCDAEL